MFYRVGSIRNGFEPFVRDFLFADDADTVCAILHPLQCGIDFFKLGAQRIINSEIPASLKGLGA
ncbi:hypothetical protein D3C73_1629610 [compost metagenome]